MLMLWWLVVCTKKGIQDDDRKTFVSIHRHLCEYGNFALHVANRGRPRSTTPEVEECILDVVN
jgi:hypothetical protein